LLSVFPETLSEYTRQALEKLGVEVVLGICHAICRSLDIILTSLKCAHIIMREHSKLAKLLFIIYSSTTSQTLSLSLSLALFLTLSISFYLSLKPNP